MRIYCLQFVICTGMESYHWVERKREVGKNANKKSITIFLYSPVCVKLCEHVLVVGKIKRKLDCLVWMHTSIFCHTNYQTEIQACNSELLSPIALSCLLRKCPALTGRFLGLYMMTFWWLDPCVKDLVTLQLRCHTTLWLHYMKLSLIQSAPLNSILLWVAQVGPHIHSHAFAVIFLSLKTLAILDWCHSNRLSFALFFKV